MNDLYVLQVELCPPKNICSSPGTSECDLTWKQGHRRCNQLKEVIMEQGGPLILYEWHAYKKRRHTDTHREEGHVKMEAKTGECRCMPRNAKNCQQPLEAGRDKGDSLLDPPEILALPTPLLQTSSLQNYEIINFCCFQSPVGRILLKQPQETNAFNTMCINPRIIENLYGCCTKLNFCPLHDPFSHEHKSLQW